VAELADAPALGAGGLTAVGVRVPSSAPNYEKQIAKKFFVERKSKLVLEEKK